MGDKIPLRPQFYPVHNPGTQKRKTNPPPRPIIADERADDGRAPGVMRESTVWDVYNNEARMVDNELVKDWTTSLNFLLVFAAIFAAVLTAFIIESKKMLEPDQTEILVDIAMQYFNNIGNQARNNLTRPDFEPTFEAISINCLLFASLGASLVAALASVVALQWVADYDATISRGGSSPLDRAKRRQFRFAGVTHWKMGELIAALPLLLYSSVVLFWVGAIQWMWSLHHIVGYVVAGGTAVAVLFYGSTTLLGAIFVSSPFTTPLSNGLYWLVAWSLSLLGHFMLWLPIVGTIRFSSRLYRNIFSKICSLFASGATLDDRNTPSPLPMSYVDSSPPRLALSESLPKWIKSHLLTNGTSRNREDTTARQDLALEEEALAWLAQQLPISDDAHERLLLCVSGIEALSTNNPSSPRFYDAPWLVILDVLSEHFLRQILDPTTSKKDYQGVGILLQCISKPFIRAMVVPTEGYIQNPRDGNYWNQCRVGFDGFAHFEVTRQAPITFLIARDVPVPSLGSKAELEATWELIRWRNSLDIPQVYDDATWPEVFTDIGRYSPEFLESCLLHLREWIKALPYHSQGIGDYTVMFGSIVEQALHRDLTTGEALALAHAFAAYLTEFAGRQLPEAVDATNIISQPLSYALAVEQSSESLRATHLTITLLLVRAARSSVKTEHWQWARWFILMLWVSTPKDPGCLADLQQNGIEDNETQEPWDEIEVLYTGAPVEGAHVEEIATILWGVDNAVVESLTRNAFEDPQSLASVALLLRIPLTPTSDIWSS